MVGFRAGLSGLALGVLYAAAVSVGVAEVTQNHIGGSSQEGGVIKGVVKFEGRQAKRKPIRMSADKYCDEAHKDSLAEEERYVFGKNDTLQNVFVWVSKGVSGAGGPPIQKPVLDQQGCVYHPHVLGVVAGQDLQILNNDNTLHNVKMNSGQNGSFNEGMPVKGMVLTKRFSKREMGIPIKCDVHPWMGSYLHVMEHPYFAVTGEDGTFEIRGLPAGDYEVSVWHEFDKFGPDQGSKPVKVAEGQAAEVNFSYSPKGK